MAYTVNGKEYEVNSVMNQRIKDRFVQREVVTNVSDIVEFILNVTRNSSLDDNYFNDAPFNYEDIENEYLDHSSEIEDLREEIEELEERQCEPTICDEEYEHLQGAIDKLEEKISDLEDDMDEVQEVFSWYQVTPFLCDKLRSYGEVVINCMDYWGRGACGQSISLDSVISEICHDMGILEGQEYSWENEFK